MAKATFTNKQLCEAWAKQATATPKGTRGNVVADLMVGMNIDPDDDLAFRKVYNNVTQRKKQLTSHKTKPLTFPELEPGKKGARRTDEQMDEIFGPFGRLGRKDLECAIETAASLGVSMPATELVRDMIEDVFLNKA